jgi:hypothetical protein
MSNVNLLSIYDGIVKEATRNSHDLTGQCFQKGQHAEDSFVDIVLQHGYKWVPATEDEDRIQHFDGTFITPAGKRFKTEIKSAKSPSCPNDILLELKGKSGFRGWLYGRSYFIAIEILNPYGFVLFSTPGLARYTEQKTNTHWEGTQFFFDPNNLVLTSCDAVAPKLYNRMGEKSIITRIPLEELREHVPNAILHPKQPC